MKFGVGVPTFDQYADKDIFFRLVDAAEDLGFDSVWFGDHIAVPGYAIAYTDYNWLDAVTCAMACMGRTSRLAFGTDVLVAPYRNPVVLAHMAVTANALFGDRLMLGMGVGYLKGEFEAVGAPPVSERGAVTDEYLSVMRRLFSGPGPHAFQGRWINFDDTWFGPQPATVPPIFVGGNHPAALRRAAVLGDGWHPLFPSLEAYAQGRETIERTRREHGIVRPFTYSYSTRGRLRVAGEPEPPPPRSDAGRPKDYSYAPPAPTAPDGRLRFSGSADQVASDIGEFMQAGVEQFVFRFARPFDPYMTPDRFLAQMRLLSEQVIRPGRASGDYPVTP